MPNHIAHRICRLPHHIRCGVGVGAEREACTVMPQGIISTVPTFMQMMGMCMAGSAIVENIFSLPGLGYRIVNSLTNRDLPVIYATVLFLAFALVIFNILADIIQRLLQTRKGDL